MENIRKKEGENQAGTAREARRAGLGTGKSDRRHCRESGEHSRGPGEGRRMVGEKREKIQGICVT